MEVIELRDRKDLFPCDVCRIFNPPELHRVAIENDVATTRVVVPRLPNAADVDHYFLRAELVVIRNLTRRIEATVLRKDTGNMRMPLKARLLDESKNPFDLSLVVNVLGEDVFVQRAARRAVNHQQVALAPGPGESSKKLPTLFGCRNRPVFQLTPSPENSPLRPATESIGVKQRSVVMIPEQAKLKIEADIDTFSWIRAVTNDITKAKNSVDTLGSYIVKHRIQGFDVAVNVAQDRDALIVGH